MTPVHTPPETRMSIFPTDGDLGLRVIYDPMLDPKTRRNKALPAKYGAISVKVRDKHTK
jgi:histone-lysine N-methyltransferase SETD1